MVTLLIALLLFFSFSADASFNDKDIEIISSMIEYLRVEQYILVSKFLKVVELIPKVKVLSRNNISGVYLTFVDLLNYFEAGKYPERRVMIFIKIEDNSQLETMMEQLKLKVSDKKTFVAFTWMMFLPKNPIKFTKNNFHVPFDCRFFLEEESQIIEIYQNKKKSPMINLYFGKFTEGKLETNTTYFYEKRMNMRGETMIMVTPNQRKCLYTADCLHTEIWEDIGRIVNFTTVFVKESEVEKNNSILPDSHTSLKLFHYLIAENENIIGPLTKGVAHLYIREVGQNEERWDSYLRPFHYELWMVIVFCIVIAGITILIVTWIALYVLSLQGFTLLDEALTPLSAFCNQASSSILSMSSSRIARISSYIASTVIVPAYSASLISYLTIDFPKIPFYDLESFSQEGHYKLAPLYVPLTVYFFMQSDDPVAKAIKEKQLVPLQDFPKTHPSAIKMICSEDKIAILNYNFRMFQYPSPCSILRVSDAIFENYQGIELFNEGTHYRKLFIKLVTRFRSSGILQKMHKINYGKTSVEKIQEFNDIGISETKPIFVFCLLSILASILLFVAEYVYYCIKSKPRIRHSKRKTPIVRSTQNLRRISRHRFIFINNYQNVKNPRFQLMGVNYPSPRLRY